MIIQTVNKTYLLTGCLKQEEQNDVYFCEDVIEHRQCLMIKMKDSELITATVEFLYKQVMNEPFTDFQDCFVKEECLYIIFLYPEGERLNYKMANEYCSSEERLEIIQKIFEQIILLDMPYYFASHCLKASEIYVKRSLDVSFFYGIEDIINNGAYSINEVQNSLKELIGFLFQEELKKEVIKPISDFLKDLEQKEYMDYLELYRSFLYTKNQVLSLSKEEMEMPKTWVFRLWERIKKLFLPLKRAFILFVLTAGLIFIIWNIRQVSKPPLSVRIIDQIGTLDIK